MKNMKKIKSVVVMLVMVLALGCISITAEAATKTKSLTMYVGEEFAYSYIGLGTVKSVKSNKSKVVKASKYKGGSKFVAKKKGKAKVTVKGTSGSFVYNITVKATPKIEVTFTPRADGYITVNVNNKSSASFDDLKVNIIYKDASGTVLGDNSVYFNYVGAKKSAVNDTYPSLYPYKAENIDWNQTTYEIEYDRSPDYKYTDYTKKVKYTEAVSDGLLTINTKISYKGDNSIYAAFSVVFYDAANNVVGVTDGYMFLTGSKKKYRTDSYDVYMPSDAVRYEIVKRAVMKKYNN